MSRLETFDGRLVPTPGCLVRIPGVLDLKEKPVIWRVRRAFEERGRCMLALESLRGEKKRSRGLEGVRAGFCAGMDVEEVPSFQTQRARGVGRVIATREIGGMEQAMVMFWEEGACAWVPFELLRFRRDAASSFMQGAHKAGDAEKLRLRVLARGLERWNENTGALSRLEIDPLPHQLHLVHHILRSGRLDWLIADDVGLGKTIEVGMLLAALSHRRDFERVLIVTPAGLTTQWQEELAAKFGMRDFLVHGKDIHPDREAARWRLFPHVIASVDRLKQEAHLDAVLEAPDWDLVIFDEAHWLTRKENGAWVESTQRYKLASALRARTRNMLLLTATPHQGKSDRFRGLLELLRPDWKERFDLMHTEPGFLVEMIYRNRKSDVTDNQGNFIFHGQDTRAISLSLSEEEEALDGALQKYFREGYDLAKKGDRARAIALVMTTFRKLAASSHAAILAALRRRHAKLVATQDEALDVAITVEQQLDELNEADARYGGELIERALAEFGSGSFFEGELDMLADLITLAEAVAVEDTKLSQFLEIVAEVTRADPARKILVFTEFRATQAHIQRALAGAFGEHSVGLIHGGMKLEEKRAVVAGFASSLQFVVSTEAGGEGLNMHHGCHTMINYDLPWNPMRLVQRMGRLYRYGQPHRVVVFNLHSPETLDGQVVDLLYARIHKVVQDLAPLGDEFHERLHLEILGEIANMADVSEILEEAHEQGISRTRARIDDALDRARSAHDLQRDLLAHAKGFDPEALHAQLELERAHLDSFVRGMLRQLGLPVIETQYSGEVLRVRLDDATRALLNTRAQSVRITTHRARASDDIRMMDFDEPFFVHMIERAQSSDFGGRSAASVVAGSDAIGFFRVCWQDALGRPMREELLATRVASDGSVHINDAVTSAWLATRASDSHCQRSGKERLELIRCAEESADRRLAQESNERLFPMLSRCFAMLAAKN